MGIRKTEAYRLCNVVLSKFVKHYYKAAPYFPPRSVFIVLFYFLLNIRKVFFLIFVLISVLHKIVLISFLLNQENRMKTFFFHKNPV